MGLCSGGKRFKSNKPIQKHNHFVPKYFKRDLQLKNPLKAWVSDIAYIQTKGRILYLTIILDLFDRKNSQLEPEQWF